MLYKVALAIVLILLAVGGIGALFLYVMGKAVGKQ